MIKTICYKVTSLEKNISFFENFFAAKKISSNENEKSAELQFSECSSNLKIIESEEHSLGTAYGHLAFGTFSYFTKVQVIFIKDVKIYQVF
jgi:hypothetical protein